MFPHKPPPDLIVEYARPRRDAVVARGGSPDSADTAKSPSPQSTPVRGRYTRSLVHNEIEGTLTPRSLGSRRATPACDTQLWSPTCPSALVGRYIHLHFPLACVTLAP
jgi:hypothetical protein